VALIIIYEKRSKDRGFTGNLSIGLLTGAPFLLGASAGTISFPVAAIFLMASLTNISREIIKDIEDVQLDEGFRTTIPHRYGMQKASMAAVIFMLLGILASSIPLFTNGMDPIYTAGIGTADIIFLISIRSLYHSPSKAQIITKLGMIMAICGFLLWSVG
jgi:geranylgeranylglycerol-phosphate geranylgeranyltransferase